MLTTGYTTNIFVRVASLCQSNPNVRETCNIMVDGNLLVEQSKVAFYHGDLVDDNLTWVAHG